MGDRYISPVTDTVDMATARVLCESEKVCGGTAEDVDRMEFDW